MLLIASRRVFQRPMTQKHTKQSNANPLVSRRNMIGPTASVHLARSAYAEHEDITRFTLLLNRRVFASDPWSGIEESGKPAHSVGLWIRLALVGSKRAPHASPILAAAENDQHVAGDRLQQS